MTKPAHHVDDTELLVHEIHDEAVRLASHPITELRRLEHVAADGESGATPLLVTLGVIAVVGVILALLMAVAVLVYYYG